MNEIRINFSHFLSFQGMTCEFTAIHFGNDMYRIIAELKMDGKDFLGYICDAHWSYYSELIEAEIKTPVTSSTVSEKIESIELAADAIASKIQGWETIFPNH